MTNYQEQSANDEQAQGTTDDKKRNATKQRNEVIQKLVHLFELDNTEQQILSSTESSRREEEAHPIAQAVDDFLNRARDIEFNANTFIPLSVTVVKEQFKKVHSDLREGGKLLDEDNQADQILGITKVQKAYNRINRLNKSRIPNMLEVSLFLGLFSAFDAYTGALLTAIYNKKPELFGKMNKSVTVASILQHTSFESLKKEILHDEIENFRRKSYVEQFEELEATFGLKLKAFERWPQFVECTQRRNLLTHCDGIVSEQYLSVCQNENVKFPQPIFVGDTLGLGSGYFLSSCNLLMEVALKLGQTLWRKIFPKEITEADRHLREVAYDSLQRERWKQAEVFGEFAIGLRNLSNDQIYKVFIVNYVIALKFGGKVNEATKLLSTIDWTAASLDFKLAEAVLLDKFDDAASIMRKIGRRSELVVEVAYYTWPLFYKFRETVQFLNAYESVYERPFTTTLQVATRSIEEKEVTEAEKKAEALEEAPSDESE